MSEILNTDKIILALLPRLEGVVKKVTPSLSLESPVVPENLWAMPGAVITCLAEIANDAGDLVTPEEHALNSRLALLSRLATRPKGYNSNVTRVGGIYYLVPNPEATGTVNLPDGCLPPLICFFKDDKKLVFARPDETGEDVRFIDVRPSSFKDVFQAALQAIFEPGNLATLTLSGKVFDNFKEAKNELLNLGV